MGLVVRLMLAQAQVFYQDDPIHAAGKAEQSERVCTGAAIGANLDRIVGTGQR